MHARLLLVLVMCLSASTALADARVLVLGMRSIEGDDELANALTEQLRTAARTVDGWQVSNTAVSMAQMGLAHGCDEIVLYRSEDLVARVKDLTGGEGVGTVFDSIGKDTYEASLKCLKRRGVLVGCGTASGPFPPIDALQLAMQGSVYFTRPALADYVADPAERAELSEALFGHIASGRLRIEINQRYALEDAVQAHRDLEAGKTTGSSVFIV